ncbi:hypothetical protein F5Y18DRAFT_379021 [Xylariaceae sp. FL1019]|nr:hypothetical protein F5Y18DRAFT_379021 [Xylariaceae sp. FL1019]
MKVLIVGASGLIGSAALSQCLSHSKVTQVIAFVRRDLPAELTKNPKLQCIIHKDFSWWPEDLLRSHADAAGMIWAMGTYKGDEKADYEYPLAFMSSMSRALSSQSPRPVFRYVQLSGKFVRQDQEKRLWFLEEPRKLKGRLETEALAFQKQNPAIWRTLVVKPGGVVPFVPSLFATIMGENWCVRNEELGAFMTHLVVDGDEEDDVIENARIVRKGREVLKGEGR